MNISCFTVDDKEAVKHVYAIAKSNITRVKNIIVRSTHTHTSS